MIAPIRQLLVAATFTALTALTGAAAAQQETVFVAGRALMPDGTLRDNVAVVVRDGKITRIANADQIADGPQVRRLPEGAVLAPGLIDLASFAAVTGGSVERVTTIDPAVSIADAVDVHHDSLKQLREAGVTSVMIVPAPVNIVNGAAAVVRTVASNGRADFLKREGALVLTIGQSAYNTARGPTSRAGLLFALREGIRTTKDAGASTDRLAQALDGSRATIIVCNDIEDADAALNLIAEFGFDASLFVGEYAVELADELEGAEVPVMLGPLGFNASRRALAGPAALASKGVELGFSGGSPQADPNSLRLTASLAVRAGLDAAAARRAMTSTSAKIAGVADRVGALREGLDADLVIFSGDPLRMDARVLEVWTAGTRIHAATCNETDEAHEMTSGGSSW